MSIRAAVEATLEGRDQRLDEGHLLEKKEAKKKDKDKFNFGVTNHARAFVSCADCSKPRLLFSTKALTLNETELLEARLDNVIYTCGSDQLFDEGHLLEKKVFVKSALTCGMCVEKAYYSVGRFPSCCCWCGETVATRFVELSQTDLGGKKQIGEICTDCHGRGLDVLIAMGGGRQAEAALAVTSK
mgnify:CR=1 FL=1|jgi:hypothetical protein